MNTPRTRLTRRSLVRTTALTASAAVIGGGLTQKIKAEQADVGPSTSASGVYEGVGTGKNGPIRVAVTLNEAGIEAIEVLESHESAVLSENALELLPQKIVATQCASVQTVSGATLTSSGILLAVANALEAAGSPSLVENTTGTDIPQSMTPGTYTGHAEGCWPPGSIEGQRFGAAETLAPVQVDVTVDDQRILSVDVVTCTDVPCFANPCMSRIPAAIVEEQSIFVDAVTGATCTSAAILRATALALKEAGANLLGFAKDRTFPDGSEEYDCDVCVVGGGCSGTMAALAVAEAGLDVLVLDKAGRIGGKGFCSSGISAAGAQAQTDAGITKTPSDLYNSLFEQSGGRANALLLKTIAEGSGPVIDHLIRHGFSVEMPDPQAKWDEAYMCRTGKGQEKFDLLYTDYIKPAGGRVMLECRATSLIQDEDGSVIGVEACRQDGTQVTVRCKAVIIGTGGFGGNPSLLQRFCHTTNYYDRGLTTTCSGDGIVMCESIGCQLGPEIIPHMQEYGANLVCNFTANLIKYITYAGFLQVNPQGQRFMDESYCISDPMGYGCAMLRIAGFYYVILDQSIVDELTEKGVGGYYDDEIDSYFDTAVVSRALVPLTTLPDDLEDAIERGQAWKAGSAEELAQAVGFADPQVFVDAFSRYNELCAAGMDEDFGKMPQMMNGYSGTLYAVRMAIPIMGTLGGVKVNEHLQALDHDENPVPGLYVAGQEGSGFYAYPYYATKCSTSTYAYTSGHLAGLNAATYAATR